MRYVIYCRKSSESEDRQALSIESQEAEMTKLAEKAGLSVVAVLKESKSAKQEGRPVFNEMMKLIEKGKIDGIICWKLDRLARNFIDGGKIIDHLQRGTIKEIHTYEGVHLPTDNVLMLAVQLGMANQYIRDLSTNVKRGIRAKLERGDWPNMSPVGYMNDLATKKVVVDAKRSKYIVRAFELYLTARYSYRDITEILFSEGFRSRSNHKVPKSKIQTILNNPFYYGTMQAQGKLYKGNHKPIISKDLFDKVQEVSQERLHPKKKRLMFPIRGLVVCADCGCMYTASQKKGHDYYHCTNGKGICTSYSKYLRENDLYKEVAEIIQKTQFDRELVEIMYEAAKERSTQNHDYFDSQLAEVGKQEAVLLERQNSLLDAFLDKTIPKEVYEKKNQEIENDKFKIEQQRSKIEHATDTLASTLEPVKKIFLDCIYWSENFLTLSPEEKQKASHAVLWNLSVKDKKVLSYKLKSIYHLLANAPKNGDLNFLLPDKDSNLNTLDQNQVSYH